MPLEEIILFLSNDNEKIPYQLQADALGVLVISLVFLYNLLLSSSWYALDEQRLGCEPQRLMEMQMLSENVSWTWTSKSVCLSGLLPDELYSLSCWNLLLPDRESQEIKIPLIEQGVTACEVSLDLPTGIYYIQLLFGQNLSKNLGWWCESGPYDIPEAIDGDEARENYCYTILGNSESTEQFIAAVNQLKLNFDIQQLQAGISSLESHHYHFPNWLSPEGLLRKLKGLLKFLNKASVEVVGTLIKTPKSEQSQPQVSEATKQDNWYLVNVASKKRDVFFRYLDIAITQNKLQDLIVKVEIPQDSVYEDVVLVNLKNYQQAYSHLKKLPHFQTMERRPLTSQQVSRMLGAR